MREVSNNEMVFVDQEHPSYEFFVKKHVAAGKELWFEVRSEPGSPNSESGVSKAQDVREVSDEKEVLVDHEHPGYESLVKKKVAAGEVLCFEVTGSASSDSGVSKPEPVCDSSDSPGSDSSDSSVSKPEPVCDSSDSPGSDSGDSHGSDTGDSAGSDSSDSAGLDSSDSSVSKPEPGSDSSVSAGWDSIDSLPSKAEPGWNSSGSSFESLRPSPEPAPLSPEEVSYNQLPFKRKHDLHTYSVRILEAACLTYARRRLARVLGDLEWKRHNLLFENSQYPDDKLVHRDWLKEDQIELKYWALFFERLINKVPEYGSELRVSEVGDILNNVDLLRNVAIHRGKLQEGEEMTYLRYSLATRLPGDVLKDSRAATEIQDAFDYLTEDPRLDGDTIARVEAAMYAPPPCTSDCQLLSQIQTLLEKSCFDYAGRNYPYVLASNGWEFPEQVELGNWEQTYKSHYVRHDESAHGIFPGVDEADFPFSDLMGKARDRIRNPAAHFNPVTIDKLVYAVHVAIRICILQADWRRAIEIEILAESYLESHSRAQVLDRLESTYRVGPIETKYEQGRRAAIRRVLEAEGRAQEGGDVVMIVEGLGMGAPVMRWVEQSWSPSMHECLKKPEEVIECSEWETSTEEKSDEVDEQLCGDEQVDEDKQLIDDKPPFDTDILYADD